MRLWKILSTFGSACRFFSLLSPVTLSVVILVRFGGGNLKKIQFGGEFSENFQVAKILAVRAGNARKWISSLKASLIQPKSELQSDRLVKICEKNENF